MMQKLERLVDLAIQYLEIQVGDRTVADPKPKKAGKAKEPEAPAPLPPVVPPAIPPATAPEMTDKESYDELCRLAIGFIAADKPGTEERRAKAMSHVESTYKVSALSGVPHGPQRLQLIAWFKSQNGTAAPASAPAGFGV